MGRKVSRLTSRVSKASNTHQKDGEHTEAEQPEFVKAETEREPDKGDGLGCPGHGDPCALRLDRHRDGQEQVARHQEGRKQIDLPGEQGLSLTVHQVGQ